jgi:hypothetical protein
MDKQKLLNDYLSGIEKIEGKVAMIADGMLDYRPEREDAWTIKEHLIHIVDCEINIFIKMKSIIAQPRSLGFGMESEAWAKNIRRKNEDARKYLALFPLLRRIMFDLLADEEEKGWEEYAVWPYHGKMINLSLKECVEACARHLDFHLEYIDRIMKEIEAK